ncbi:hypothetical protein LSPH26S_01507 [Lysinibacillus sphaericus]
MLNIQDISKSFGSLEVVYNLSFTVQEGEFVAIIRALQVAEKAHSFN